MRCGGMIPLMLGGLGGWVGLWEDEEAMCTCVFECKLWRETSRLWKLVREISLSQGPNQGASLYGGEECVRCRRPGLLIQRLFRDSQMIWYQFECISKCKISTQNRSNLIESKWSPTESDQIGTIYETLDNFQMVRSQFFNLTKNLIVVGVICTQHDFSTYFCLFPYMFRRHQEYVSATIPH